MRDTIRGAQEIEDGSRFIYPTTRLSVEARAWIGEADKLMSNGVLVVVLP